jgi:tRNA(Ile)-lysidine synthase
MGSHPPTLIPSVRRTLLEECRTGPADHLLLAVSGGPDSMALLHVLSGLRQNCGFVLSACGVDHGLRADALSELLLAQDFASRLGVPFEIRRTLVEPGGNLHARARRARYAELEAAARTVGAMFIATAHHQQDRAETVLIRLLRGAGPMGLGVLSATNGNRLRPMIRAASSQVRAHLARHDIPYALDPSNADPRFLRTRVRNELLPLLQELSPGIVGHLTSLADELDDVALPEVLDERGVALRLSRAHRAQLRQALRHRRARTHVLIGAGRAVELDLQTGQPRVVRRDGVVILPELATPSETDDPKLRPAGLKKPKTD